MAFFNVSIFTKSRLAVDAVYTDANGGEYDIRVIFNEPYAESQMGGTVSYQNTNPTALANLADVPNAAAHVNAETLEVNDVVYNIIGVEPQDDGSMVRLVLSRDAVT